MTGIEQEEIYLNKHEFMEQFVYDDEPAVYRLCGQGLPRKKIDGVWMYPKQACHRWFAGEEVAG